MWDGKKDLHGLLGIERERYRILKKYVPNYKINLIDPRKLEDLKCFKTDLQMIFGMLKYKNSKVQMKEFVNKNNAQSGSCRARDIWTGVLYMITFINKTRRKG